VTLTSPGPVLYRDRRIGLGEREFDMLKFRTMYADAAEHQAYLERANEASGPLFKMRRDPRVTPLGQLLRRFSLDEIPQVLNVLRGQMSLVGPSPLPRFDDLVRLDFYYLETGRSGWTSRFC
jgi:lipopolysaccharide/colanic/teichoic acid biosynthesis glycosyltransferase